MLKYPHKLMLHNDLLGSVATNTIINYFGFDSEQLYNTNLHKAPNDWYYRNKIINYNLNSYGHRCTDIDKIDFDNYILFTGDSFSMGVGLELETTYPYLISDRLKINYYNLGLGGTGLDTMMYNLNAWFLKYPKPKCVIIYYSDYNRFVVKDKDTDTFTSVNASASEENHKKFMYYGNINGYLTTRYLLYKQTINLLIQKYQIPYYHISFIQEYQDISNDVKIFKFVDKARDLLHAGIESHKNISEYIVSDYTDKYTNATVNSITRGQI